MRTTLKIGAAAGAALALAWAGQHALAGSAALPAATSSTATSSTVTQGATVTGKVVLDGEVPELPPLKISAEQGKGCCKDSEGIDCMDSTDRSVVVGEDKGLANVVVIVDMEGAEAMDKVVDVDQKQCRFEPHVTVVTAGTKVKYLNSDSVSHNVHTYAAKNDSLNQTVAPGASAEQTLEKGDKIELKCDIHPWMNAWIFVTESPHYAITDENGQFELKGLPDGEHELELWHEKLGRAKADVVVKDGKAEAVEVKMSAKSSGGRGRRR